MTSSNLTHKDFFFCYDNDLSRFLKRKGISYLIKSRSIKNNNVFTLYHKSEKLNQAIHEYQEKCKKCI